MPVDIGDLEVLKKLDVRECGIKLLPSSIKCIKSLETLVGEEIVNLTESPGLSKIFDMFICFMSSDTRYGFRSHLYDALVREGTKVFMDEYNVVRGEEIGSTIIKGIQGSRIAIVIVSENFAFSRWCLTELRNIVDCMDTSRLIGMPIFYHVNPSHVRKLLGSYGEAFKKHENNPKLNLKEVETWRDALKRVSLLSGWALREIVKPRRSERRRKPNPKYLEM